MIQRDQIIPVVKALFATMSKQEVMDRIEKTGVPFDPIDKPADLFENPHLNTKGGLDNVNIPRPDGTCVATKLPATPIEFNGETLALRRDLPRQGQDSIEVLRNAGYSQDEIESLIGLGIIHST